MATNNDNRRIKIYESDLTSGGTTIVAEDVVYVPGFVGFHENPNEAGTYVTSATVEAGIPTLCSTISEFNTYFGEDIPKFAEAQAWPDFATAAIYGDTMFASGALDPGYVYAKELINAGLPVVFERCNDTQDEITVEHMYSVLNDSENSIWTKLQDLGEYYEIKYLTTGGYPTFEYHGSLHTFSFVSSSDDQITSSTLGINASLLKKKLGTIYEDLELKFIYGYPRTEAKECATIAERDTYKESATEDQYYYVAETKKLYKIKITTTETETTREWEEVTNWGLWKIEKYGITSQTSLGTITDIADISAYGITLQKEISSLVYGTTIKLKYDVSEGSPIAKAMLACAATRGDCVALIDHTNNPERALNPALQGSVYWSATNSQSAYNVSGLGNCEFGAMFTPWCGVSTALFSTTMDMPGSFVYLKALAKSIQSNGNWLAIAGATRGLAEITELSIGNKLRLSNAIAEDYQPRNGIAINPITNIKPYGYVIWGNRTLKNNASEGNLTATSFLNMRNIISDVKKAAYLAARKCMFEQNSDILWNNYKARVTPTLDKLVSGSGLSGYSLIKGTTSEKAKLVCTIRLYPLYAVESFEITVELSDDEITVS